MATSSDAIVPWGRPGRNGLWMAAKVGQVDHLLELQEQKLKNLATDAAGEALLVAMDHAA